MLYGSIIIPCQTMKLGNISDSQQVLQKQKETLKKKVNPLVYKSL